MIKVVHKRGSCLAILEIERIQNVHVLLLDDVKPQRIAGRSTALGSGIFRHCQWKMGTTERRDLEDGINRMAIYTLISWRTLTTKNQSVRKFGRGKGVANSTGRDIARELGGVMKARLFNKAEAPHR